MQVSNHTWVVNVLSSLLIFVIGRASAQITTGNRLSDIKSFLRKKSDKEIGTDTDTERTMDSLTYVSAIYDKLLKYFERDKPYLDAELSISDVAKALLTNKMYVAKAIKTFARTNYPQFVNSYRIRHAIQTFEKDTSLRVGELAFRSGFNSAASFNIAFKANMNMTPGEWCRRYKLQQCQ